MLTIFALAQIIAATIIIATQTQETTDQLISNAKHEGPCTMSHAREHESRQNDQESGQF